LRFEFCTGGSAHTPVVAQTNAKEENQYFMHRDCQSRNIMVKKEDVFFIDYQGGMQGALQYDIASLLWQARAQMPYDWRDELVQTLSICLILVRLLACKSTIWVRLMGSLFLIQLPMAFNSTSCAWFRALPFIQHSPSSLMVSVALLSQFGAMAQDTGVGNQAETSSGPQQSTIQRVEIVARQGSTELRRAASVAKQIYGREELDRYGDTNTLDVLRRLPGVNVDSGGPRMRGLGAGYTQILINGDPAPQGFNLDQLSPSQIERIEVLKAPTADQSAQASAGKNGCANRKQR
jgi:hypothetical protein